MEAGAAAYERLEDGVAVTTTFSLNGARCSMTVCALSPAFSVALSMAGEKPGYLTTIWVKPLATDGKSTIPFSSAVSVTPGFPSRVKIVTVACDRTAFVWSTTRTSELRADIRVCRSGHLEQSGGGGQQDRSKGLVDSHISIDGSSGNFCIKPDAKRLLTMQNHVGNAMNYLHYA